MDRRQIALRLVTEALGLEFRMRTFDDRLIMQKAVYLAQAAGLGLGYHFQWYLRGPYSPVLARDAFSVDLEPAQGKDESKGWVLDARSRERLGRITDLFQGGQGAGLARKAELLASVHFLVDSRQAPEGDVRAITEILKRYEKDFTEEEVKQALEELAAHGLLGASR